MFVILRDRGAEETRLLAEFEALGAIVRQAAIATDTAAHRHGMRCFVEYWNGAGRWDALSPATQETTAGMIDLVAHDITATLTEPRRLRDYASLPVPILLVSGQHSPAPVRHMNAMLTRTLPAARAASIVGAGHMTPISHATVLARLIADHVDTRRSQPWF